MNPLCGRLTELNLSCISRHEKGGTNYRIRMSLEDHHPRVRASRKLLRIAINRLTQVERNVINAWPAGETEDTKYNQPMITSSLVCRSGHAWAMQHCNPPQRMVIIIEKHHIPECIMIGLTP